MQPPLGVGRFGVLTSWPKSLDYHGSSQYSPPKHIRPNNRPSKALMVPNTSYRRGPCPKWPNTQILAPQVASPVRLVMVFWSQNLVVEEHGPLPKPPT